MSTSFSYGLRARNLSQVNDNSLSSSEFVIESSHQFESSISDEDTETSTESE